MNSHAGVMVLLDRDGTLIEEKHYLHNPDEVVLLSGVGEGLSALLKAGFRLAVVTNQSGIGRGYYTESDMHAVNARMEALLAEHGVRLEGIWFCPHSPDTGCECRKPAPGMVLAASEALDFIPEQAIVIGDKFCDVALARAVGAVSVLVRTGYGEETAGAVGADYLAADFMDAVQWIMAHDAGSEL